MNDLGVLIESITPLYNSYKKNKNTLHPKESIKIMWDLGNILNTYIEKNNLRRLQKNDIRKLKMGKILEKKYSKNSVNIFYINRNKKIKHN